MASGGNMKDPLVAKKLFENLQGDLRLLSTEGKRKHPNVKEASEQMQLKLRTIAAKNEDTLSGLVSASTEILHPFMLGCETKNVKLIQIALTAAQRLISHEAISVKAADDILTMLWGLMESGLEELKLLQTAILLITTNFVVQHESLAKAMVLCLRLHFTKDSTTNNTAAAAIKHLVSIVFERVCAEDNMQNKEKTDSLSEGELKQGSNKAPKSLRPCAGDAYLLFQDLCQLVNADQPYWLVGMTEMTRTFGLELLESVLTAFPKIFSEHQEFGFLLKERVCPLVIKLFSPSLKYRQGVPAPPSPVPVEKPFFPVVMRLLRIISSLIQFYYNLLSTECEIFLSLLVKFLEPEKPMWQRCLALEVLHKLFVQPELVKSFCLSYDMKPHSTKIFRDMINGIGAFIQSQFMHPPGGPAASGTKVQDVQGSPPSLVAGMPVGGGVSPQPAFMYRGVWIPLILVIPQGQTRPSFLEMLDKVDPPTVPDGYGLSVGFYCLVEAVRTIQIVVEGEQVESGKMESSKTDKKPEPKIAESGDQKETETESDEERLLFEELVNSSWCGMMAALTLLLDASTDESATESVLKCEEAFISLCGKLGMTVPRDAFITALCKASLPPHYALTVLNTQGGLPQKGHARSPSQDMTSYTTEASERSQVVAVGTPLPTASLPIGAHQGSVMLTAKNIQCMRSLLAVTHCHGGILGTAWHLVLTTLQHLVWILGLKPSSGGSLKVSQMETTNQVITTAVMADLPILSSMLSRLFESSQYLDDVALHHLIDALCKLSTESMELAYSNREPSLFAVAKLLETGLVNLSRAEILWRPVTSHLLEVSQHPHAGLRNWGAEAVTNLVKSALAYKHTPPLHENTKLQASILAPLQDLSTITQPDIRQKQLQCVFEILHDNGDSLSHGWPLVLGVIGAVTNDQGEKLVQTAFQSLQLVVTDFLPIISCYYLEVVVDVAAKFGLQKQELNVSLTAIGLLWNISDYFYQNRERIKAELETSPPEDAVNVRENTDGMSSFDALWMCLFSRLGELCVDGRPAVRKSAGQTLFSTISAHGGLLQENSWKNVLWKVLFPLLDNVKRLSSTAPNTKDDSTQGNILIHHSRDTAEKQWAETRVLTLAGVARTFTAQRKILQGFYKDFPHAWALLLDHIEGAALCQNAEISIAAIKSFQEMLLISKDDSSTFPVQPLPVKPPTFESINRTGDSPSEEKSPKSQSEAEEDDTGSSSEYDIALWSAAWKVWLNIGTHATKPPEDSTSLYVPSQPFLTALIQTFPPLLDHIKVRFSVSDLKKLSDVLKKALTVPVHGDSSPFIIPTFPDVTTTPLQEATLQAVEALIKTIKEGPSSLHAMYPDIFDQLLAYVDYGVRVPKFGKIETKQFGTVKGPTVDWVTMNFVPFAERCVELVVDMYKTTAVHTNVIQANVLQNIIKTFRQPLSLKYGCPSQSTWMLVINSLLNILSIGLPVARKNEKAFQSMWTELGQTLEDFLFSKNPTPPTLSIEDFQRDEALDCKVVLMVRDDILPYANNMPKEFVEQIMSILNKGSIHSTSSDSFIDTDSSRKLREEFAKTCFETLLQFSYVNQSKDDESCLTKLAVISLLQRCQEVVRKYAEDEKLSGKCPLPRPRLAEMSSVLKAVTTLIASLKRAPQANVEVSVWNHIIQLYPHLVECTTSPSPSVCKALRDALKEYKELLTPPTVVMQNGR